MTAIDSIIESGKAAACLAYLFGEERITCQQVGQGFPGFAGASGMLNTIRGERKKRPSAAIRRRKQPDGLIDAAQHGKTRRGSSLYPSTKTGTVVGRSSRSSR